MPKSRKPRPTMFWVRGSNMIMDLLLILGPREYAEARLRELDNKDDGIPVNWGGMCALIENVVSGHTFVALWVDNENMWSCEWYGCVAHEVTHFADRVLQRYRWPVDHDNGSEIRAVIVERTMTLVLAGIRGVRCLDMSEKWKLPRLKGLRELA